MLLRKFSFALLAALTGAALAFAQPEPSPAAKGPAAALKLRDLGFAPDIEGRIWLDEASMSTKPNATGVYESEIDVYFLRTSDLQTPHGVMAGQTTRIQVSCEPTLTAKPLTLSILGPDGKIVTGPVQLPEKIHIGYEDKLQETAPGKIMAARCTMVGRQPAPVYATSVDEALTWTRDKAAFDEALTSARTAPP